MRGFTFSRMKAMVVSSGVPGPKMAETPFCLRWGMSSSGMVPPRTRRMSSARWALAGVRGCGERLRCGLRERMERPMQSGRPPEWRHGDDHLGGLAETGVDDFHAGVAEGSGDDFCAAVVAV